MAAEMDEWNHSETSGSGSRGREDWGVGWDYGVNLVWHQGASCFGAYLKFVLFVIATSIVIGSVIALFE